MEHLDYLSKIAQKIAQKNTEKLIYGSPVEAQGKNFIPVTKTVWNAGNEKKHNAAKKSNGEAFYTSKPVGFLEVTQDGARFIPVRSNGLLMLAISAGVLAGWLLGRKLRLPAK